MAFEHLKAGDAVMRLLGGEVPVALRVKEVDDKLIYCQPPHAEWPKDQCWKFWRDNGAEVDEDLGWDGINVTGSYLTHS